MRRLLCVMLAVVLLMISPMNARASLPYESYNYDFWGQVVPSPAAYVPVRSYSGSSLGTTNLNQPADMVVSKDGLIYILDTGNNRLLEFDKEFNLLREISTFDNKGTEDTFNRPSGVYVTKDNDIYIADSENRRIVVLEHNGQLKAIIENPQSETFADNFVFVPLKVGVDFAGRVYVIARGVFEGIMSFDENGRFYGYVGTINVSISPTDIIWRALSTKEQRDRQILYIPTEFTGLDIDTAGFVYTTNVDNNSDETIKRLNPSGNDVLKRPANRLVKGDIFFRGMGLYSGPSRFTDIVIGDKGIHSSLDTVRGRIFTYDHEGNLLYVFGGLGSQLGTFKKPTAIEKLDTSIFVLDQERGEVIVFEESQYGRLINTAVGLRYDGDEEKAVDYWQEVLKMDANFELAYVGIGKSLLAKGDNKGAMRYLQLGMDQKYYSVAYKRHRNEVLKEHLGLILTGVIGMIVLYNGRILLKKRKRKEKMTHA